MSVYGSQHWIKAKVSTTVSLEYNLDTVSGFHFPSNPFHFRTLHLGLWQFSQRGEGEMGTVAAFTVIYNLLHLEMERGDQFPTIFDTAVILRNEEGNGLKRVVWEGGPTWQSCRPSSEARGGCAPLAQKGKEWPSQGCHGGITLGTQTHWHIGVQGTEQVLVPAGAQVVSGCLEKRVRGVVGGRQAGSTSEPGKGWSRHLHGRTRQIPTPFYHVPPRKSSSEVI